MVAPLAAPQEDGGRAPANRALPIMLRVLVTEDTMSSRIGLPKAFSAISGYTRGLGGKLAVFQQWVAPDTSLGLPAIATPPFQTTSLTRASNNALHDDFQHLIAKRLDPRITLG